MSASTRTPPGPPGTGSPSAPSSRWPKRPMGISGWAAEFGLFRFDGVRSCPLATPCGSAPPQRPYSLLVTRDGTLWIGTFAGLVSWKWRQADPVPGAWRTLRDIAARRPRGNGVGRHTGQPTDTPTGRLCAIRSGRAQCYGEDGAFGSFRLEFG